MTGTWVEHVFEVVVREDTGNGEPRDPPPTMFLIVVYSDKTHKDVLGWHQCYPVYMYLGNVHTTVRGKKGNAGVMIGECMLVVCTCVYQLAVHLQL